MLVVLLVAMALAAAAPAANASDRSVKRAWDADDAKFEEHGERVRTLYRRWERSGFRKHGRALIAALGDTRRTLDGTRAGVRAETASSETGAKARYWALRSMRAFDSQLATEQSAVRARTNGRRRRANRLFDEAETFGRRAIRFANRAKRLFRQVLS